jgi:hypothetical protein
MRSRYYAAVRSRGSRGLPRAPGATRLTVPVRPVAAGSRSAGRDPGRREAQMAALIESGAAPGRRPRGPRCARDARSRPRARGIGPTNILLDRAAAVLAEPAVVHLLTHGHTLSGLAAGAARLELVDPAILRGARPAGPATSGPRGDPAARPHRTRAVPRPGVRGSVHGGPDPSEKPTGARRGPRGRRAGCRRQDTASRAWAPLPHGGGLRRRGRGGGPANRELTRAAWMARIPVQNEAPDG